MFSHNAIGESQILARALPRLRCRSLHDHEAGSLKMLDQPLGDDLRHEFVGVMDSPASFESTRTRAQRRGLPAIAGVGFSASDIVDLSALRRWSPSLIGEFLFVCPIAQWQRCIPGLRLAVTCITHWRRPAGLAGSWTPWRAVRGPKSAPIEGEHELFGFVTTEPNAVVAPIIPRPCRSF